MEHALTIVKAFATASHQGYHAQHDETVDRNESIVDNIPPELLYMTIHGKAPAWILLALQTDEYRVKQNGKARPRLGRPSCI